jgi:hypothetical protein
MSSFTRILRFLWAAPVSVPSYFFYVLPAVLLGWYVPIGATGDAFVYIHGDMPAWLQKLWVGWRGQCVGNFIIVKNRPATSAEDAQLFRHEQEHCAQVMKWGIFQPIFYYLCDLGAWMAGERAYLLNPFEVAARRAAGQKTEVE